MAQVLQLERALDVRCVGSVFERARAACSSSEPVEIDGAEVKSIDSAGAQLLFALISSTGARASWRLSAELERELVAMGFPLNRFSPRTP